MLVSDSLADAHVPSRAVPRPVLWVVVVASAVAMLAIGMVATIAIFAHTDRHLAPIPRAFGAAVAFGLAATATSLAMRAIRWI